MQFGKFTWICRGDYTNKPFWKALGWRNIPKLGVGVVERVRGKKKRLGWAKIDQTTVLRITSTGRL